MLLREKVALVTGGGRGIGRAIALRFAAEGAAVVVSARTQTELDAVVEEIRRAGGRAAAAAGDVTSETACAAVAAAAEKTFGRVDILVNNAGIFGPVKPLEEVTAAEWDDVMAANLRGVFLMTRAVLAGMYRRSSGAIINLGSIAAKAALTWQAPYSASKAAVLGLTRALAAEAAAHGVRVNAICPGPVPETKMSQDLGAEIAGRAGGDPERLFARFLENFLQRRPQTAAEVAAAAVFLASDQASAITGQALNVDGGMNFY
jgi:NAD(P)-dependent dehydrogenase (short-subunit alcohol dehydrogenase family)